MKVDYVLTTNEHGVIPPTMLAHNREIPARVVGVRYRHSEGEPILTFIVRIMDDVPLGETFPPIPSIAEWWEKLMSERNSLRKSDRQQAIDLGQKIQFLVNFLNDQGLLEDDSFTFPDGDTWPVTGTTTD